MDITPSPLTDASNPDAMRDRLEQLLDLWAESLAAFHETTRDYVGLQDQLFAQLATRGVVSSDMDDKNAALEARSSRLEMRVVSLEEDLQLQVDAIVAHGAPDDFRPWLVHALERRGASHDEATESCLVLMRDSRALARQQQQTEAAIAEQSAMSDAMHETNMAIIAGLGAPANSDPDMAGDNVESDDARQRRT